jgi:hypothetical protein
MRIAIRALIITSVVLPIPAMGLDLYVATNGNDSWNGRQAEPGADKAGPFATLERARDEVRKLRGTAGLPGGPATVHVRGGIHSLARPLEFTATDSGTEQSLITYLAYKAEKPRIIGGREVTNFKPVTDEAILNRLESAARPHVRQADLKALGITDLGVVPPGGNRLEVFFEDRPMTLARWPNGEYTKVGTLLGGKPNVSHGRKGDEIGTFTYEGDRPSRWKDEKEIWLNGYWFWDWADAYQQVESIDADKHAINIKPPYHVYGYRTGQRYVALNLLSEIDSPGEWYLDRQSGMLYFWPPAETQTGKMPVSRTGVFVSVLKDLIVMKDASHVTLQGLTLEFNRDKAIIVEGGSHVRVAGCTLRNIGGDAVAIRGGTGHSVIGCDLYDIGDGGIRLDGGDRAKLVPGKHLVLNNHFYRYSRNSKTYRPAVSVNGMGHRIAHNLIHDAPHMAIQLSGNEHVIEFNEMYRVCTETDDAGAFYTGRDWTWRGNRIQYNYFHHMGDFKTLHGVQSVYLDDCASASTVYSNVFYKAGRGVLLGGGRNNVIDNNIFVDCTPAIHVDSRGLGWFKSFLDDPNNSMYVALRALPYKQPPWSTRYPELVNVLEDEPGLAKYNTISRNICVGRGKWLDLHDGLTDKVVKLENNLTDQDPRFVDAAHQDFRLKDDSPALQLGFTPIPVEKIGLYNDPLRVSWPPPQRPE